MKNDVKNVVAGDKVFYFGSYSRFPQVKTVTRITNNFVFIEFPNSLNSAEPFEKKFRRDGSGMDRFDGRLATIEPGDIEKFEQQKKNEQRINEIINLLNSKGFKFNGNPAWYSIEQWEKLAAAFNKE